MVQVLILVLVLVSQVLVLVLVLVGPVLVLILVLEGSVLVLVLVLVGSVLVNITGDELARSCEIVWCSCRTSLLARPRSPSS